MTLFQVRIRRIHAHHVDQILRRVGPHASQELRVEGMVRFLGFASERLSAGPKELIATGMIDTMQIRCSLLFQHVSTGGMGKGSSSRLTRMGIILMRSLTSGVFQRLMAEAFPEIDVLDVGRLLLNHVLSDPFVDVALVGVREPRFVEINNAISDDAGSQLDLAQLDDRYVR